MLDRAQWEREHVGAAADNVATMRRQDDAGYVISMMAVVFPVSTAVLT